MLRLESCARRRWCCRFGLKHIPWCNRLSWRRCNRLLLVRHSHGSALPFGWRFSRHRTCWCARLWWILQWLLLLDRHSCCRSLTYLLYWSWHPYRPSCWWVSLILILLDCLLMTLLQCLHLLLLFVASVDSFSYGTTNWTTYILTSMIVTQNIPRTYTVRH